METISKIAGNLKKPENSVRQEEPRTRSIPWIVLPFQAQEDIKTFEKLGQSYRVMVPEKGAPGACSNCQGLDGIWLRFIISGPHKSMPQVVKGQKATWIDDGWYRVISKFYPCPACSDPKSRIPYLFERSGLEPSERAWRIDYIAGMEGKDLGLAQAHSILDQIPNPTGWVCVFGGYGVGKSGLVKSMIAECISSGVPAGYIRAADLLREIRSTFAEDALITEKDVADRFGDYRVLAIDEVDRIPTTAWSMSTLMTILDERYNRRGTCLTMLCTNADPNQLPAGFEYLSSRMKDGLRILLGGKELRG